MAGLILKKKFADHILIYEMSLRRCFIRKKAVY